MPMLDLYIPQNAIEPKCERTLIALLTDMLLEEEGVNPSNPRGRELAWVFLHRPAEIWVGGAPSAQPHYKVIASVPEGQYTEVRRARMISRVTQAIFDAEPSGRDREKNRVWVFASQVPEGTWGAEGRIFGLSDIAGHVLENAEFGRAYAPRAIATVRAERQNQLPPGTEPFDALPSTGSSSQG